MLNRMPSNVVRWAAVELAGLIIVFGLVLLYGRLAPGVTTNTDASPVAWVLAPTATVPPTTPRPGLEPTLRPMPPTTTPTPSPSPTAAPVKHVVKEGETLSQIADQYSVSSDAIVAANSIQDRDALKAGQELTIPVSPPARSSTVVASPAGPARARSHTVQAGDTLGGIAVKYGVTTAALIKANNLDNADALRIGQELVIPPP